MYCLDVLLALAIFGDLRAGVVIQRGGRNRHCGFRSGDIGSRTGIPIPGDSWRLGMKIRCTATQRSIITGGS